MDLVAVSSWCRPQPPSSNPIVLHCRRFLVVSPTVSSGSNTEWRICLELDAGLGRVAVGSRHPRSSGFVSHGGQTVPNSLVACHSLNPCVSIVPRALDPDRSRRVPLGRWSPRPVEPRLIKRSLLVVSLPGGLSSARSRVSGLGSAPDCFYQRIRVGNGHRVSSPLTSNDPIGFREL